MKNGPGALNRIYRLVWNDRTGAFVAVSEGARGRGKRSSGVMGAAGAMLAAGLLGFGGAAAAADPPKPATLPSGGQVVAGQAQLRPDGGRLDIVQDTARAAINWQSFDIGSAAQVNFLQPNANAVTLNRVLGADPSALYGRLTANGQVLLVNPNGIVFGKGSQVDVGGIVASTLALSDADFMAGRLSFTRNGATGSVLNQGRLSAAGGGYVALLAPEVINEGVISAQLGSVALAAGDAMTLDVRGSQLLGVKVDPASIAALVENRQLIQAEGGRVILSAGAAERLLEQAVAGGSGATALVADGSGTRLVSVGGRIEAAGGQVAISGSTVDVSGQVLAGGRTAGRIDLQADYLGQGGTLDASASAGRGGSIAISSGVAVQTAQALLNADGSAGGGSIRVDGAAQGGTLYSSARFSAQGTGAAANGGEIAVSADSVQLRAATLDASGSAAGGRVRVGGGFHGADTDIANASTVGINGTTMLRADAGPTGDGGQVVVWSDGTTTYGGQLSARGGARSGRGGQAEVSGKGSLVYAGTADLAAPAGAAGTLLLDPRNIIIDNAGSSLASLNLADPTPSASNGFGSATKVLGNGNVLITAPNAATGGSANTGAVYLFDSSTGGLLANLRGSHAGDHAGSAGVQVLGNGNYLVLSPSYATVSGVNVFGLSTADSNALPGASAYALTLNASAAAGAITWQSASGSGSGLIGSGNSLVGSTANTDSVTRYSYSGSTINNNGATTVTANDRVGGVATYDSSGQLQAAGTTTVKELADGNVAIATPNWFNGRGAVTWMDGSTGALTNAAAGGAVSASVAFVGSTPIRSQAPVSTDSNSRKVYVTGVDASLPYTYTQGATNRRTAPPGAAGDSVGQSLTLLPDGGYVIASPLWTHTGTTYAGAVTHGAAGGSAGTVGSGNSLVGSHAYDFVGSGGVTAVGATGANYVVASPYWADSGNAASGRYLDNNPNGAVTWVDGSSSNVFGTGSAGATVSTTNSLTGSAGSLEGARASSTNAPYTSYDYNSTTGLTTVSGTRTQAIGTGGVTHLANGNYLVVANAWNGGRGSVSFGTGAAGIGGAVSASNSLVGTAVGDSASSSVVELSGSNYVVVAPGSDLGAVNGGAVTWGSGTAGVSGTVATSNSLYGTQVSAAVGSGGVVTVGALDGAGLRPNYIVLSPQWGNRSASTSTVAYGAVSWVDGSNGNLYGGASVAGALSATNSLVGNAAGDYVGSIHTADYRAGSDAGDGSSLYNVATAPWDAQLTASVNLLANGDYIVRSPNWGGGKGAITWGAGASGTGGAITSGNSLVGSTADVLVTSTATQTRAGMSFTDTTYKLTTTGDHVGLLGQGLANGNYIAISPYWSTGRGAVTWVGGGNRTGTVGSANSLVGSTPDVYLDANQSALVSSGDRLGTLPNLSWVVPVVSEATVGGQLRTTTTLRPVGPYAFDSSYAIATGNGYSGGSYVAVGKNYNVTGPRDAAFVTEYGYTATSFLYNGYPIVKELTGGNVLVASPGWNNGSATRAGAVSWINGATGALAAGGSAGAVSAGNSLVGSHSDDVLGFRLPLDGVAQLSNGNFLLVNPQWYAERGAVTWGSGTAGVTGTVSAANSLVGSTPSGSLDFGNGAYRLLADGSFSYDWIDRLSDQTGDRAGLAGVTALADGNAVIGSPFWSQTSGWTQYDAPTSLGAATWINGSNGQLKTGSAGGSISPDNSLVGRQHGDAVGYAAFVDPYTSQHYLVPGVTALAGGRYAVASPWWSNGATAGVGAVTFGDAGGSVGAVSAANSLVGATAGDHVGRGTSSYDPYTYAAIIGAGVQVLKTGSATNYLVRSTDWTNPYDTDSGGAGAGAATWVDGSTGRAYGESGRGAVVSVANSLVGNVAGDGVGGQLIALTRSPMGVALPTGDLLLLSNLAYCGDPGAGAVTLLSGTLGAAGPISWRNSIIGLASASNGLATTGFDGSSFFTDIRATLLPTAVTASEQVAWRPLVWVNPNGGANATQALALTVVADSNAAPVSASQINGSGGNANWSGSLFAGNGSGYGGVGGSTSTGLLGFSASTGGDVVITPATLTALLNAGTAVTLQASNDITVLRDITVSAGGNGGNLTLEAGRSVHIRANITTDNGTFTALANQSAVNGVVDADCSVCEAVIRQAAGTSVNAGNHHAALDLLDSTDKTYNTAGTMQLSSLYGDFVRASNAGLNASAQGRGIRFNSNAVIGNSGTERIELFVGGSTALGGALALPSDTRFVGTDTLNVATSDLNAGMTLGATSGPGLAMTAAEMGAVIKQSSGFNTLQFGSGDQVGATVVNALDFTQASMLRGSSTLAAHVQLTGGTNGIDVNSTLKSGAANGYNLELFTFDGTITFGAASVVTASTGNLAVTTFGGNLAQIAGSTVNATRLNLGGDGAATLTAGTNTIGSLAGNFGSANIKTTSSVAVGSGGLALDSGLVLQASGATSDITLNGNVSTSSGNLVLAAGRDFINTRASNTGLNAGSGRYLVYSTNPTATTEAMTGYSKHYAQSYSAGSTPGYAGSGNWFLYSVAPTLGASVGSGSTVTYGSTASAPGISVTGFIDGDTLAGATTGSLNTTVSAYTASGAGYIPVGSYTVALNGAGTLANSLGYALNVSTGSSTFTVQAKAINASGLAATNKVYDGTTIATLSGSASVLGSGSSSGDGRYLAGDSVAVAGTASGAFSDRHAGTAKSVTLSGLSLSGADAGNYTISSNSVTANITPKTLDVSGLTAAASKVYDRSTAATVSGSAALRSSETAGTGSTADGKPYSLDTVSIAGSATGTYNSANVATANLVTFGGLTLSGAQAGDYTLAAATQAATITPKALTLGGLTAQNKVYDSTATATLTGSATLSGSGASSGDGRYVNGDTVSVTGSLAASFADANAGTGKAISTSGLSLAGSSAGNYTLTAYSTQADITRRSLNVTADNKAKSYGDADPLLSFTLGGLGLVGSDTAASVLTGALTSTTGAAATAGTHAITQGSLAVTGNYQLGSYTAGTLTVAKAALNATADAKGKTYGDTDPTLTYSVDAAQLKYGDTAGVVSGVTLATDTGAAATAGTHAITASGGTASNYTVNTVNGILTVAKAALTATADARSKTYGDVDPTLTYTVNTAQLKYGDTAGVVSGVTLATDTGAAATAGTHVITASGGTAANYTINAGNGTLTVAKAALNVSADAQSKTYGDIDPTLTYSVSAGQLKYGDTAGVVSGVTLATDTGAAATAGTHAITASGGTAANYTVTAGNGTLTVAKAALNATADAKGKTYGDADPTLTYSVDAAQLKYGDTAGVVSGVTLATDTGVAATAGTHAITASGGTASNYTVNTVNGTLTVAKAALTATADARSKTYGDVDPSLSYSVNTAQLKYGDTAGVVSGVTLATDTGAAATAGTHVITASGGTAANYTINAGNGTLTVAKAALNVSADAQSKTYGDIDSTLTYSVSAGQLKYGDTASVVSGVTLATDTGAAATAGTHVIAASGGTAANYTVTAGNGTLTVAKAALNATADAKGKTYGDTDPTLTYSVDATQLKYGDTAGVVSGVTLATDTGAAATAGTHVITASGGTASNYTVNTVNGTLTVAKAALTATADARSKTYGDVDPSLSYSVNTAQLKYGDTAGVVSGVVLSADSGAAATAGTHVITASGGTAANYTINTGNGTLTVAKAALNVSADAQSKAYGDIDPTLTYSVSAGQLKYGDTAGVVSGVNLSTDTGAAATAGTHVIAASGGTAANYTVTAGNGTLTVAKAALTATADAKGKTYGDADPTLTYSVDAAQLKYGDTAGVVSGVTLATDTGAAATAGTHAITASGGTASNYTVNTVNGTLTVAKAALTATADARSKTYGDADPTLSYSVNTAQLKYGDTAGVVSGVTLATDTGAAATAGTHVITASGGTAANYTINTAAGTLTVAKAALTATADARSKTYGDVDPTLTYAVSAGQLKYGDTAGVVSGVSLSTDTGAAATAGTHVITASGGTAANYAVTAVGNVLTVAKAPLTVVADDQSKTAGERDPLLSWHVDSAQLRYTDASSVVSGVQLSVPGSSAAPGDYAIVAASGQAANYALRYQDGTLTVKPSAGVNAENLATQVTAGLQGSSNDGGKGGTSTSFGSTAAPATPLAVAAGTGGAAATLQPGNLVVRDGGLSTSTGQSTGGNGAAASTSVGVAPSGTSLSLGAGDSASSGNAAGSSAAGTVGAPSAEPAGGSALVTASPGGSANSSVAATTAATATAGTAPRDNGTASATSDNGRLVAVRTVTVTTATAGQEMRVEVGSAFERPADVPVTYSAAQGDGSALPSWLKIDPKTGTLSGRPRVNSKEAEVLVVVTAQSERGETASARVTVAVQRASR